MDYQATPCPQPGAGRFGLLGLRDRFHTEHFPVRPSQCSFTFGSVRRVIRRAASSSADLKVGAQLGGLEKAPPHFPQTSNGATRAKLRLDGKRYCIVASCRSPLSIPIHRSFLMSL